MDTMHVQDISLISIYVWFKMLYEAILRVSVVCVVCHLKILANLKALSTIKETQ